MVNNNTVVLEYIANYGRKYILLQNMVIYYEMSRFTLKSDISLQEIVKYFRRIAIDNGRYFMLLCMSYAILGVV